MLKLNDSPHLRLALTHSSVAVRPHNNQRLEFLGDSLLSAIVTARLYERFPSATEGELSCMRAASVQSSVLATIAEECGLRPLLKVGPNVEINDSMLADTFEAVLAAMVLNLADFDADALADRCIELGERYQDYKTRLQEVLQRQRKATPTYQAIASTGSAHQREFAVGVYCNGELLATGRGKSKQAAEKAAAATALMSVQ